MKLGARIFKTGLSVMLSLYIAQWLFSMKWVDSLQIGVIAGIAAVLTVQPSVYRSWKFLLQQVEANVIGAIFGIVAYFTLGNSSFAIGFTIILVIAINLKLKLDKSLTLSVFTVLTLMLIPEEQYFPYALERFGLVMLGVLSSILVNVLFAPPKYEKKLLTNLKTTSDRLSTLLRMLLEEDLDEKVYKEEKDAIKNEIDKEKELFSLYQEEFNFKKTKFNEAKKIVIFKQMLALLKKEFYVIQTIKKHLIPVDSIPEHAKHEIKKCLYALTSYDEKIFFKYEKQLKVKNPHEKPKNIFETNKKLSDKLMALYKTENEDLDSWFHLLTIITALIDLSHELERLEQMIDNYLIHNEKKTS